MTWPFVILGIFFVVLALVVASAKMVGAILMSANADVASILARALLYCGLTFLGVAGILFLLGLYLDARIL